MPHRPDDDEIMKCAPNVPVSSEGISREVLHLGRLVLVALASGYGESSSITAFPFKRCIDFYVTAWGLAAPPTAYVMAIRVRDRFTG